MHTARLAWSTEDRETGLTVHHFKTTRDSDGVCVGEHTETRNRTNGLNFHILWGRCDLSRTESLSPFDGWLPRPKLHPTNGATK